MKVCMSTASTGQTFGPTPFMRGQPSLCFHPDHGPMQTHSFPAETLSPLACKGFCCPLQQRPGSGRVTPQSRGGGDGRLILLSGLKGRLESKAKPTARARTGKRAVESPQAGAASVGHHRDQVSHTAENPITPWNNERQACDGRPGAVRVSKLHLYLPSTRCEDLDRDSQTEEIRPSADSPRVQEPDVKPNNTGDQCAVLHSTPQSPSDDIPMEDS
ncbi:uncharacterized protein LOC117767893 isoform X1 [Hippoglossus hippoglossus]|uniref:uncharacterized protein LOC117767893 isoform X1 n=1 Tax=Hippoglossus hippoglossus TaxID=8267 RepID=UPI00148D2E80|nr:uncharacterized protein LOC117767893 isoform X1 [Hippoglossus hippoglossus]XP_034451761.1 uncharacterized protein LOC117767893 isoform X1 [Hippoglossus hippoglossus]